MLTPYPTQRLLATLARVQPSTAGILDGESQDGSLVELDTGSESAEEEREQQRKAKGKKKVLSKKKKEIEEKKGKGKAVAKGKGRKAKKVEESESESESEESGSSDDQMEVDEVCPQLSSFSPTEQPSSTHSPFPFAARASQAQIQVHHFETSQIDPLGSFHRPRTFLGEWRRAARPSDFLAQEAQVDRLCDRRFQCREGAV